MLPQWANGFMWTAWVFVFITMLLMGSYILPSSNEFSVMTLGLIIAGLLFLISFLLFSWITIQKKTFAKTNRAHQSKPFNRETDTIAYFWSDTNVLPW